VLLLGLFAPLYIRPQATRHCCGLCSSSLAQDTKNKLFCQQSACPLRLLTLVCGEEEQFLWPSLSAVLRQLTHNNLLRNLFNLQNEAMGDFKPPCSLHSVGTSSLLSDATIPQETLFALQRTSGRLDRQRLVLATFLVLALCNSLMAGHL